MARPAAARKGLQGVDTIPRLFLRPQGGDGDVERGVLVESAPFWVGRRPENDWQIVRPDISGRHAQFEWQSGAWALVDNHSTNGTFVNGKRLDPAAPVRIREGDVVFFATKGFQVRRGAEGESHRSIFRTKVLNDTGEVKAIMQVARILNEHRTVAHFQPIYDLDLNEAVGWEALGRAVADDGLMSPAVAFGLAAQNRSEAQLSRRFRESAAACARCHVCWGAATGGMLFVNLHPEEMQGKDFVEALRDLAELQATKLFRVVVEVPESWVARSNDMRRLAQQLRGHGLLVAYDDFGVGQSRLTDLRENPPDFVKLDRELISQAATDKVQYDLVKAIVDACRKMQVRTLGEGIETEAELQACRDMRMNLGQGYYFSRGLAAHELFRIPRAQVPAECQFVKLNLLR